MSQGNIYEKIQYGPEASAYGTEAVSYNELARVQSVNLSSKNNLKYDRGVGEGINASNTYYGLFNANGDITFDVVDFDFLKHWVGPKTGAGSVGDPYILTEATKTGVSSTLLQPFSIEKLNDDEATDSVQVMTGCVGQTFTLSGSIGSKLSCAGKFTGQKSWYRTTSETYVPSLGTSYVMLNGTWKWGASPSTISGVRDFKINYTNGLKVDTNTIESRFITIPKLGERMYDFEVSIIMASTLATTIINDFYGYVSSSVYSPEDGSNSISPTASLEFKVELTSGSKVAYLNLDEAAIEDISTPTQLGGGLVLLTFKGGAREGKSNVPITWWTV